MGTPRGAPPACLRQPDDERRAPVRAAAPRRSRGAPQEQYKDSNTKALENEIASVIGMLLGSNLYQCTNARYSCRSSRGV